VALEWHQKYGKQLDGWNRRHIRGDKDIPSYFYERPELDAISIYYFNAWCEIATERPVIATMAGVTDGVIPRSKIKAYAEDDLGLVGEEIEFFIEVIRRVERKSTPIQTDPALADQVPAGDTAGVKAIVKRLAPSDDKQFRNKKPRVRHPR
jgi:hypothetical protein